MATAFACALAQAALTACRRPVITAAAGAARQLNPATIPA
jgi:hypothetical protein